MTVPTKPAGQMQATVVVVVGLAVVVDVVAVVVIVVVVMVVDVVVVLVLVVAVDVVKMLVVEVVEVEVDVVAIVVVPDVVVDVLVVVVLVVTVCVGASDLRRGEVDDLRRGEVLLLGGARLRRGGEGAMVVVTVVVGHGTLSQVQPRMLHFLWMYLPMPHSGSQGQTVWLHIPVKPMAIA